LATLVEFFGPISSEALNFLEIAGLSPVTKYQTFDTEHFHFIYKDGYFAFTEKAALYYEQAHSILSPILKWSPRSKTTVVIADNEDSANGFTLASLRVGMVLIATPPEAWFSTSYTENWIKLLVFHEYTHFLNLDPTTGWMEGLRLIFGDVIRPNGLWPVWALEGLAVYFETRTSKLGRGRSPYYDGILRAYLNENRFDTHDSRAITLDRVNGEYPFFPGGEIPYLFGYHLWNEISKDHERYQDSDQAMGEVSIRSSSRIPYFINGNLKSVMNRTWPEYWERFVQHTEERLGKQIEAIKKDGESKSTPIAGSSYSAIGGAFSPNGQWLAYTDSSMQDRTKLVLFNRKTGESSRLTDKMLGAGLAFTPDSKFLIYSALVRVDSFELYSDLFAYELSTGMTHTLTQGRRAKDPCISPDGKRLGYLRSNFGTPFIEVAELNFEGGIPTLSNPQPAFHPRNFSILGSPHFLNDREIIFSDQELGSDRSDLKSALIGTGNAKVILSDGSFNRFPTFDHGRIFYTSDLGGINDIWVIENGTPRRVTHVITGAQFPVVSPEGELHANLLTSDGFQLVKFNASETPVRSSAEVKFDAPHSIPEALREPDGAIPESSIKEYSPWASLAPRQWAPIAEFGGSSNAGVSFGALALGFDAVGKHQYSLAAGYNTKTGTWDGAIGYTLYAFRPELDWSLSSSTTDIAADLNHSQYRTKTSFVTAATYPFIQVRSSIRPSVYLFAKSNKIHNLADGRLVSSDDFQYQNAWVPGFGAKFRFQDNLKSRLAITSETGNVFTFGFEDRLNTADPERSLIRYIATWNHYFGLGNNQVIESRIRWLGANRSSDTVLAGKNTNDLFDRGTGADIGTLNIRGYSNLSAGIRNAGAASLDWHFPIARPYSGLGGTEPAFLKQIHGFLFAECAAALRKVNPAVFFPAFGAGATAETTLLIRLPVKFNLEYQKGTNTEYGGDSILFFSVTSDALF
jgi:Tol biopolymer transport system component